MRNGQHRVWLVSGLVCLCVFGTNTTALLYIFSRHIWLTLYLEEHFKSYAIFNYSCLNTCFFCYISKWLKTKCQISMLWFMLFSQLEKRKEELRPMNISFLNCYSNKNQNIEIWYFIFGYQSSADATKETISIWIVNKLNILWKTKAH